jgi:tetratricopeptide (TPR) repeat protein
MINPYNVDRLVELGQAFMQIGEIDQAKTEFEEALSLDKKNKSALSGKSQTFLIDNEINEALNLMNEIGSVREKASIFNSSAIICVRQKRFEAAQTLYDTAMSFLTQFKTTQAKMYYNQGLLYFKWGKKFEAFENFKLAVEKDGDYENAKFNANVLAKSLGFSKPFILASENSSQELIEDFDDNFDDDFDDESF